MCFRTILDNRAAGEIPLFRFVIMAEDFCQKDSVAFRLFLKSFFFLLFFRFYFRLVNSNSNAVCIES